MCIILCLERNCFGWWLIGGLVWLLIVWPWLLNWFSIDSTFLLLDSIISAVKSIDYHFGCWSFYLGCQWSNHFLINPLRACARAVAVSRSIWNATLCKNLYSTLTNTHTHTHTHARTHARTHTHTHTRARAHTDYGTLVRMRWALIIIRPAHSASVHGRFYCRFRLTSNAVKAWNERDFVNAHRNPR